MCNVYVSRPIFIVDGPSFFAKNLFNKWCQLDQLFPLLVAIFWLLVLRKSGFKLNNWLVKDQNRKKKIKDLLVKIKNYF